MNHHNKEVRLPIDKRIMRAEKFNPDILSVEEGPHYEKDPAVAGANCAELMRRLERYVNKDGSVPVIPGISLDGSDRSEEQKRILMLALGTVAGVFAVFGVFVIISTLGRPCL